MFKRIVTYPGFWRSVLALGISFVVLFIVFKWIIEGFKFTFFSEDNSPLFFAGILLAGLVYGFFVAYGKFWKKLKEEDR